MSDKIDYVNFQIEGKMQAKTMPGNLGSRPPHPPSRPLKTTRCIPPVSTELERVFFDARILLMAYGSVTVFLGSNGKVRVYV